MNFDPDTPAKVIMSLLGSRGVEDAIEANGPYKSDNSDYNILSLPTKFDARKKWLRCNLIGKIRDQGLCGSGWVRNDLSA